MTDDKKSILSRYLHKMQGTIFIVKKGQFVFLEKKDVELYFLWDKKTIFLWTIPDGASNLMEYVDSQDSFWDNCHIEMEQFKRGDSMPSAECLLFVRKIVIICLY